MAPPSTTWTAALAILAKGAALLLVAYTTVAAIVAFVPEGNDYAQASAFKHHLLAAAPGRRIVLIGGSNLAFGIDSSIIEQATGCATVNMGMNGRLGLRFLLEETRPYLRRGDIAVAAFEYDGFYEPADGHNADQLMIVKANPQAFAYLDWPQRQALVSAVPYVAQEKLVRLTGQAYFSALDRLDGMPPEPPDAIDIDAIESFKGFNERGDLVSHLGIKWPWDFEDGVDMSSMTMDATAVPLLAEFGRSLQARGVDVVLSYTSVMRRYFERHKQAIESLHAQVTRSTTLLVPSPPDAFVYDEALFFDTVYHLNAEGRRIRSVRVAQDIGRALGTPAPCRPQAADAQH